MKKLCLILLCFIFISCQSNNQDSSSLVMTNEKMTIESIFPFKANVIYSYKYKKDDKSLRETFFDYVHEDKAQQRIRQDDKSLCVIYETDNGSLYRVNEIVENYDYLEDFTKNIVKEREVVLKEPLEVGKTWDSKMGEKVEIKSIDKSIKIMGKEYEALELSIKNGSDEIKEYYVNNIGLVKTIEINEGEKQELELVEMEEVTGFDIDMLIISADLTSANSSKKLIESKHSFKAKTNTDMKKILSDLFKEKHMIDSESMFSPEAKILDIVHFADEDYVKLNVSNAFILDIQNNFEFEGLLISALVDTVGNFYNVSKVELLKEGEGFSYGQLNFKKGEKQGVNKYR